MHDGMQSCGLSAIGALQRNVRSVWCRGNIYKQLSLGDTPRQGCQPGDGHRCCELLRGQQQHKGACSVGVKIRVGIMRAAVVKMLVQCNTKRSHDHPACSISDLIQICAVQTIFPVIQRTTSAFALA